MSQITDVSCPFDISYSCRFLTKLQISQENQTSVFCFYSGCSLGCIDVLLACSDGCFNNSILLILSYMNFILLYTYFL